MFEFAANLEWLFAEEAGGDEAETADRVRAAAALGLPAVEIWGWRAKNLDRLAGALTETGLVLQTMCVEPMGRLTDPATHPAFLTGVAESAAVADRLSCPYLVVTAGDRRPGVAPDEQRAAVVAALRQAATLLEGRCATLLVENLNSRVDHVATFLDSTTACLDILDEVGSAKVRLLYDLYHSLVMGERPEKALAGRVGVVAHVQIADVPGRHEPGTGRVDWDRELSVLAALGYRGRIGLEYRPAARTARSLEHIMTRQARL